MGVHTFLVSYHSLSNGILSTIQRTPLIKPVIPPHEIGQIIGADIAKDYYRHGYIHSQCKQFEKFFVASKKSGSKLT